MAKNYILDTNVVISLAKYSMHNSIHNLMEVDGLDYYKAKSIEKLYQKIENGEINAYICPQVYDEIYQGIKKFGTQTINYLINSKVQVITNVPIDKIKIINKLGNYYFEYKSKSGETAFDTHDEKYNGKNDAFIMAFCSVCGTSIITFDKHFTTKYFTIKEANQSFKNNYLCKNNLLDKISKNFDNIKIHKPTYIMKKEFEYSL